MDCKVLDELLYKCNKHAILQPTTMRQYRFIGSNWKMAIENNFLDIKLISETAYKLSQLLWYNRREYGKHYYKRKILLAYLSGKYDEYINIRIFKIRPVFLDDEWDPLYKKQYISYPFALPEEYNILLNVYKKYPSIKLRIYPVETMQKIILKQRKTLMFTITTMETDDDMDNMIQFVPICYSKHYKNSSDEEQYILAVTYVNIICKSMEKEFDRNMLYKIIKIPLEDLDDKDEHFGKLEKELNYLERKIKVREESTYFVQNIKHELTNLHDAVKEVLKWQNFNM